MSKQVNSVAVRKIPEARVPNQIRLRPSIKQLVVDYAQSKGLTISWVIEHCITKTLTRD